MIIILHGLSSFLELVPPPRHGCASCGMGNIVPTPSLNQESYLLTLDFDKDMLFTSRSFSLVDAIFTIPEPIWLQPEI